MIDQASLFVAAGICAAALSMTMASVWLHNRADRFLVGGTIGMLLLGGGVILYSVFPSDRMDIVATAFAMETGGFVAILAAAREFTNRALSPKQILGLLAAVPVVATPILAGFDGVGIAIYNFFAGAMLTASGALYWSARSEAPSSITAMTVLYGLAALSFFACGVMLVGEGRATLGVPPDNWAEQFNAMMCIAGITGIGALSLGLNNARAARRHREEARTDALTGLLNRRALFDTLACGTLGRGDAVVAFDLDNFKAVNDRYGHAAGDEALKRFSHALRRHLREGDLAARTGGEEFVLVLRAASLVLATKMAERIRTDFAASRVDTQAGSFSATASAGIALAQEAGERFEDVLLRADTSLYRAKDDGRDCVVTELQAVA